MGYGDAHQLMSMRGVGIAMQRMHWNYKCMKAQTQRYGKFIDEQEG